MEGNDEWEVLDENFQMIQKIAFSDLIQKKSIPYGIEHNSYIEVFEACYRILYL
jgi:hypothetical protein